MKSTIRTMSTFAMTVVCLGVLLEAVQAQTVYQGTSGVDLDTAAAWSSGIPAGQTATINVAGANLPRWQSSMSSGTIVDHTAGVLTFTTGPYNSYGASGVSDFTYNMSGGGMTGSGQEINVNKHTFNLSGGDISSTVQFRLLNSGVLNLSGSGTLDAPTIAGTAGTMNFVSGWTGSVTIDDLDAAGWKTMLATTLAGSTFDGTDITTANFDDYFVVSGSTLTVAPLTWNNAGSGSDFATADNWNLDRAPISGSDSIILDSDLGASRPTLTTEFQIGSGQSMTAVDSPDRDVVMSIGAGGNLVVGEGGTLDLVTGGQEGGLSEASDGGCLTIEAGATKAEVYRYWNKAVYTNRFIANASGVTPLVATGFIRLRAGALDVDLSNYDINTGTTIVLFDYASMIDDTAGSGFSATNLTAGWTADIDYAHDQGGGDLAIALTSIYQYQTLTWDDTAGDDNWSSGANWVGDPATGPRSGDSVVLTATAQSLLDGAWTIVNGASLTSATTGFGDELVLQSDSDLTLATGGTMDIGFMRPRFTSGGQFTIEPGASLDTDNYGFGSISATITFEANAAGVTTWNNTGQFQMGGDNLVVDLSNYDIANGSTLVLVDYNVEGDLGGQTFASVDVFGGLTGTIDYAYDQGGGDLAIAITGIKTPGTLFKFK